MNRYKSLEILPNSDHQLNNNLNHQDSLQSRLESFSQLLRFLSFYTFTLHYALLAPRSYRSHCSASGQRLPRQRR